jgi:predicted PurR-regulated permease PerM
MLFLKSSFAEYYPRKGHAIFIRSMTTGGLIVEWLKLCAHELICPPGNRQEKVRFMVRSDAEWRFPRTLLVATLITAALYFAQDVFIPFTLAALLSFLLTPLVTRLERSGFNRTLAVLIVVVFSVLSFGSLGWIVTNQLVDLAEKMPRYKENVENKLHAVNGRTGTVLRKAVDSLNELGQPLLIEQQPENAKEIPKRDLTPLPTAPPDSASATPTRVTVVARAQSTSEFVRSLIAPFLAPLGKGAIVIILVIFMLIEREELRDRLIRIAGPSHINVTTQALNDAGARVSRYLLMQLAINSVYGATVALGLYCIGVPQALMWGMLATVLRFLPYLGFWIALAIPFFLALASPSWHQPIETVFLFGTLELVVNQLEPGLYGSSTGLSSVAVLGAALFWTWLWGGVGLLLSTPLTVVLVVMGKHMPNLNFLNVVLGDKPALAPHMRLYQRMLATDTEEAEDLFDEFTTGKSLTEAYDTFALPALVLAELDFHHDQINEGKLKFLFDNMKELVQEFGDHRLLAREETLVSSTEPGLPVVTSRLASVPTLCLPARDEADEIAGTMLEQVLHASGVSMHIVSADSLAGEMMEMIEQQMIEVIGISAVPPSGVRHARYLYKRIRAQYPRIPIVVGLWHSKLSPDKARRLLGCTPDDTVAMTIAEASKHFLRLVDLCSLRQQETEKAQARRKTSGRLA